jgi:hypothetical protein
MHASRGGNIESGSTAIALLESSVKAPIKIMMLAIPMCEIPRRDIPRRDIEAA